MHSERAYWTEEKSGSLVKIKNAKLLADLDKILDDDSVQFDVEGVGYTVSRAEVPVKEGIMYKYEHCEFPLVTKFDLTQDGSKEGKTYYRVTHQIPTEEYEKELAQSNKNMNKISKNEFEKFTSNKQISNGFSDLLFTLSTKTDNILNQFKNQITLKDILPDTIQKIKTSIGGLEFDNTQTLSKELNHFLSTLTDDNVTLI